MFQWFVYVTLLNSIKDEYKKNMEEASSKNKKSSKTLVQGQKGEYKTKNFNKKLEELKNRRDLRSGKV